MKSPSSFPFELFVPDESFESVGERSFAFEFADASDSKTVEAEEFDTFE